MSRLFNTKSRRFGKQYIRYLISYMTILLIPLVILTLLYSSSFMKKFYEEIYETVDLELIQSSKQLENELNSMQNIVIQLALNGSIHTVSAAEHPLALNPVINTLSGFTSASSFVEDTILFINGSEYVVTSTTTAKKSFYLEHILRIPVLQDRAVQELLLTTRTPLCLPVSQLKQEDTAEGVILFSYPLYSDYQKYEGNAVFVVKTDTVQNLISHKLQSYQSQIYILDQNGDVVATDGIHDKMRTYLPSLLSQLSDSRQTITDGQEEYLIRTYKSPANGWYYYAFIPNKQSTFTQVSSIMNEFLAALVTILLLASFTIYVLQKINYAPMRRLRDKARIISPEQNSRNELETIDHALEYLTSQNTTLSTRLADSQTAVLNERIYRLLSGSYSSREDFNLDCSELDLTLPFPCFVVSIFVIHDNNVNLADLAQELRGHIPITHVYYYLHTFHPSQIVFLLNLPEKETRPAKLLQKVQEYASGHWGLMTTVGIGSCVDSTEDLAQSYMEAVSALDYRFVKGNGTIIDIKEVLNPTQVKIFYPNQEFEVLRNALMMHSEQHIRAAIQSIIAFMEQNQLPLYLARSICYNLIHMVNEHCRGMKRELSASPLELSGMETARDIIGRLHDWSSSLDRLSTSSSQKPDISDILSYLDNHCLSCDFSAYEAAGQFDMTLPALSKFFKDMTGQNIMDYTISRRMAAARQLLKTTALPLKKIAEQVGYYNLSSFTRRFKLHQGITPSEYRKL